MKEIKNYSKEVIDQLISKIDLRQLLKYGQILIEYSDEGFIVTTDTTTLLVEQEESYMDNKPEIEALCKLSKIIKVITEMDSSKYAEYRFNCGLDCNGEKSRSDLRKFISSEQEGILYDAGYDIIKRTD